MQALQELWLRVKHIKVRLLSHKNLIDNKINFYIKTFDVQYAEIKMPCPAPALNLSLALP
jgi:hypothetical protein